MNGHRIQEPERLGRTVLPGGRALGWAEWGPEDGVPVLLCPGAATSRRLGLGVRTPGRAGGRADDPVAGLGVRLICLDRPGLGVSDPAPEGTLSGFAEDVRHLVAERGLHDPAVIGFSQGAPFALACAWAGVVRAAAVVSGSDELAHPGLAGKLAPDVRAMVEAVAADPRGAEADVADRAGPDVLCDLVVRLSGETDRRFYTAPGFARPFRRAVREGFAQGPGGYAHEVVLTMSRWPFDPAQITVPVDLWYGARDTSPVHSPDLGASLARRIGTARRHVVSDAGGALLWTHARAVLTALLERHGHALAGGRAPGPRAPRARGHSRTGNSTDRGSVGP
ncbi:alpha/beta fold hydrolase [Streptomyces thermodiastaticus]|uniref:alpha/beta fold hydrolase n=1 Tax=Streptomyces thermodiastaticus TaxID=44061 RepID=UPI001671C340|nr:alpha/beta hydrolase [Streptomyces thermodiastaticus]MCE7549053.1 alpha/beta hydrolase [Streptomyces thermodiastaticus]GHF59753.1 hypothetical protein GCM10018787_04770 [Streptomyces thermodiastaticus]